jgi:predicted Kef-type K+ transport protein
VGVFAVVAGIGVNAWEEFPLNLLIAISLALRVTSKVVVAEALSSRPSLRMPSAPDVSAA